jgi:putative transposase
VAQVVIARPTKKRCTRKSVSDLMAEQNKLISYAVAKPTRRSPYGYSYTPMTKENIWAEDFTYLWFEREWHYLALVIDLKTRRIVGWTLGSAHTTTLTTGALTDALRHHRKPTILHSDQGSEYRSHLHHDLCLTHGITMSCSSPGSPWQNAFVERVMSTIKEELPPLHTIIGIADLYEFIDQTIHYYNTRRIYTSLKMPPQAYADLLENTELKRDTVLPECGG